MTVKTLTLTVCAGAALVGQPAPPPEQGIQVRDRQVHFVAAQGTATAGFAAAPTMAWSSNELSFETMNVKGAPFSGEFVTETSQTLADGNRIRSSNTTSYARDGEGRTRREVSFEAIGPWAAGAPRKTIFIHDPVAQVEWVLDPQEKTARKIGMARVTMSKAIPIAIPDGAGKTIERKIRALQQSDVLVTQVESGGGATMERTPLPPGLVLHGPEGAVLGRKIDMIKEGVAGERVSANFKNESLGSRMIEGVVADGTRTVVTIPAGQIGNERDIETISERWYSNELKTVVMTSRTDPRSGESTYKLTNLRRGEPSRLLFEVPAEYRIIEPGSLDQEFRIKLDKR